MSETPQTPPSKKPTDVRLLFFVLCLVSLFLAIALYRADHPETFDRSVEKMRETADSVSRGAPRFFESVGNFAEYVLEYRQKPSETLPLVLPERFEYVDDVFHTGSAAPAENPVSPNASGATDESFQGGDPVSEILPSAPKDAPPAPLVIRVGRYEIELKWSLPKGERVSFSLGEASVVIGTPEE